MNKITLTFLGLCLTLFAFGQGKNQKKWDRVVSEMAKANQGDTISVRSKGVLDWSDFKMSPDLNKDVNAYPELTFGVYTKKVNVWTGVITVESYGGIRKDLSWIKPEYKSQQLLDYIQVKYVIAHHFAKKSEKEINSGKINAGNVNKINGIIEKHLDARDKALNEFDTESNFGNNAEAVIKWKEKLRTNEL